MTKPEAFFVGDRDAAKRHEIMRAVVGSGVHGMAIDGTDDQDEMGVYIETPEQVLGLTEAPGHYVSRTVAEGQRSGPGDVDLTMYSLRKYLRLATAGNPTVLLLLYVHGQAVLVDTPLGAELRQLRTAIVSRLAGRRFLGYLDGQRKRLVGEGPRRNRVPNRPELIERYGYDTKYASHALRLGLQGLELMTTGHLSLPMPPEHVARCRAVKLGEVSFDDALVMIDEARASLDSALFDPSVNMPDGPDLDAVNAWMISAQRRHWGEV